ncbi:EthD domain-containing protein [Novosphingobium sp. KN65.2]|uniref:EthD domain-containing protein n=1 Tax=Novosphingobium sp. KN65.2 TaxID=1478134 RepID=UPI0005DABB3F|nr:EthD domain-containing protein [Novosphingobium sp. KN65.2]CDO34470.1 conserved hypothetical protein [Novosphingobium sp. KN65.2]
MEKVIGALWSPEEESRASFGDRLLATLPAALEAAGARKIRLNIRDETIAPADPLVQRWQRPQQDAVVQFWMPSSNARFRQAVDAALNAHCARFALWLVCESEIIANTDHISQPGERTCGWSQASFISFLPDMGRSAAIAHWHSHHTRVAIETQANFEYIQNLIVRPLTEDAPAYDAFVEECFPREAMNDPRVFFDAGDDEAKFKRNAQAMTASCEAFIDFTRIDVIPTSQFDFGERD